MKKLILITFLVFNFSGVFSQSISSNRDVNQCKKELRSLNSQINSLSANRTALQEHQKFLHDRLISLKEQLITAIGGDKIKLISDSTLIEKELEFIAKKIGDLNIEISKHTESRLSSLCFVLNNDEKGGLGGPIPGSTSIGMFEPGVSYTFSYQQSYSLDLTSALNNAILPGSQFDFFYKIKDGYFFRYFDVKASGALLSDNLRTLTSTGIGFVFDSTTSQDTLLNAFQEFEIPTVSELIQLAKIKGYIGINVWNNKPYGYDSNYDHPHLFAVDLGAHFIFTPLNLDPALDAAQQTLANINREIRELKSELDDGLGNPLNNEETREKIENLTNLADVVGEIPQLVELPNIDKLSNLLLYISPSLTYAYAPNERFNIQLYGQYFHPLKKLELSKGIYDLQKTEYLSSDFGSLNTIKELGIDLNTVEEITDKEDFTPKMFTLGAQVALELRENVSFNISAQYLHTIKNADFDEFNQSGNSKLAFFGMGITYTIKGKTN